MPIANCIITSDCNNSSGDSNELIKLWASESKKSSKDMTINITTSDEQHGKRYTVMATYCCHLFGLVQIFHNYN